MEYSEVHNEIKNKLNGFLASNKIPHILFHGSSGSGKRTIFDQFIQQVYKNNRRVMKENILDVNCSQGKGIKFIRDDLKFFCKMNIQNDIPFKTVLLLNADSLTIDAQSALRRCIEVYSNTTRFFIIVENKHKLLKPIQSRFCEIYVPEYQEKCSKELMNLHQKYVDRELFSEVNDERVKYAMTQLSLLRKDMYHHDLLEVCNTMYLEGVSCFHMLDAFRKLNVFDDKVMTNIQMYFDMVKMEYRNELLLMLCVVDKLFHS
jgi:hypothetical protein